MSYFKSYTKCLVAFVLLLFLINCGGSDEQPFSGQTAATSKHAIIDTAVHVQAFMYVYFGCMSANFTSSLYPHTIDQLNENLDYLEPCMYWLDYELEAIDSGRDDFLQALEDLNVMEQTTTYPDQKFFKGFFNLFRSTSTMKSNLSQKFFDTANKLSQQSKTDLYDLSFSLLDAKNKAQATNENLFFQMVKTGTLNHQILNLHNNACRYNFDYADIARNDNNLPGRVITRDVSKIVASGGEIVVGVGKSALSGLSVVSEAIDVAKVTKDLISSTDSTSNEAIAKGKSIEQDIHDRLINIGLEDSGDLSVVEMAKKLSQVLTDQYVDAVVRDDHVNNVPALLDLGYSQISIQPDIAHTSAVGGNLDNSLMIISTGDDLFSGTRIVIASSDTVNNPVIVTPATYDVTVVSGDEVQQIKAVSTTAGQNLKVVLDEDDWTDRSQNTGDDDDNTSACSGDCDIMVAYQYCTDDDLCLCDTGGWYTKNCQDFCEQSGLGDSTTCQKDSQNLANCVCTGGTDGDVVDGDIVDGDTSSNVTCSVPTNGFCSELNTMPKGHVCIDAGYDDSRALTCFEDGTTKESEYIGLCNDDDPTTFDACDSYCTVGYKCLNVKVAEVGDVVGTESCNYTGDKCIQLFNESAIGSFEEPTARVKCVDSKEVIVEVCKCKYYNLGGYIFCYH